MSLSGDAVYEQVTSYDPVTNEATIVVPPHNTKAFSSNSRSRQNVDTTNTERVGVKIIIGEKTMVTVTDEYCIFEEKPANINLDDFKIQREDTSGDLEVAVSGY